MTTETPAYPWYEKAGDEASKKALRDSEFLQGVALLAVAEAIHRLSAAVEEHG